MNEAAEGPPYDPALLPALAALPDNPLLDDESYEVFRSGAMRDAEAFNRALREAGVVQEERTIVGPGSTIKLLVVRPEVSVSPSICVLAIHSGGMVLGDRFGSITDQDVLHWVTEFGIVVVSPEYRLAPSHPAPAGVDDCYATLEWIAANAAELGIDPGRILVSGVSGGGGLAAGAVLMARDNDGPAVLAQLLVCPMLDDKTATVSARQYRASAERRVLWPTENNRWAWDAVLGEGHVGRDDISPYAAPSRATDFSGLPPTYLDCGSAELFRDEVVDYASRLWGAGTQAELHIWAGGVHAFDLLAPDTLVAIASRTTRENWLRRILTAGGHTSPPLVNALGVKIGEVQIGTV
jgi:acetyl esterase/lipase